MTRAKSTRIWPSFTSESFGRREHTQRNPAGRDGAQAPIHAEVSDTEELSLIPDLF
jgi:hypothetical protein